MSGLPPITRPNGKVYRPRYLRVAGWDIEWSPARDVLCQVAVLGTHDVDKARECAPQGYHSPYLINPETGWVRLGLDHGEPKWIHDDVKGAACVIFDESDDPPEVVAAESEVGAP